MKTTYLGMLVAMTMLSLSACSNKEDVPQEPAAEGMPICFKVSTGDTQSRASHAGESTIEKFGLSINGEGYSKNRIIFEKSGIQGQQIWTPTSNVAWLNNSPKVQFIAFYPSDLFTEKNDPFSSQCTFDIEENQTTQSYKSDVMGAHVTDFNPATVTAEHPMVSLEFKHVMSQLQVVLSTTPEMINEVNSICIDGTNRRCQIAFNENNRIVSSENPGSIFTNQSVRGGNTVTFKCILIPQTVNAGKLTVSFAFDGKYYVWTSNENITLGQNCIHTLNLTINNTSTPQAQSMKSRNWGGHTAYEVISNSMN